MPLTVKIQSAPRSWRYSACAFWVCNASAVTTASFSSIGSSSGWKLVISLLFPSTCTCPSTTPDVCSNAASRCGVVTSSTRAPRVVFPSTAISRRPTRRPARFPSQAATADVKATSSTASRTRRNVASSGTVPSNSSRARTAYGTSQGSGVVGALRERGWCGVLRSRPLAIESSRVPLRLRPVEGLLWSVCRGDRRRRRPSVPPARPCPGTGPSS